MTAAALFTIEIVAKATASTVNHNCSNWQQQPAAPINWQQWLAALATSCSSSNRLQQQPTAAVTNCSKWLQQKPVTTAAAHCSSQQDLAVATNQLQWLREAVSSIRNQLTTCSKQQKLTRFRFSNWQPAVVTNMPAPSTDSSSQQLLGNSSSDWLLQSPSAVTMSHSSDWLWQQ